MTYPQVWLGLDAGSVSLKVAALDDDGRILHEVYVRHNGRPAQAAVQLLEALRGNWPDEAVRGVAVTGSGGERLARALGGVFINEIVALSTGLIRFSPKIRTAVEIGGQDSKLLEFEGKPSVEETASALRDFAMNSLCAAGTGSFLDQQATRLGVAIEDEFGQLALQSENPPRIAGRCSV
ncbi:hypothetical protein HQ520_16200, partial [bacterium]|nr:hypothetical protein [bacterium]